MTQFVRAVWNESNAQYETDRGTKLNIVRQLAIPSDGDEAKIRAVVTAAEGRVVDDPIPCTSTGFGELRHLLIKRRSGHTAKIPIHLRASGVDLVKAIVAAYDAVNPNNPVVCFDLVGEVFLNLYDDVVSASAPAAPIDEIKPPTSEGKARIMYTTTMTAYTTDIPYRQAALARVNMITNVKNQPPSNFPPVPGCIGAVRDILCGGKTKRTPRRYIATFMTNNAKLPTQEITIPSADGDPAAILDCGQKLANLAHVICLRYEGESIKRMNEMAIFN